MTTEVKKYWTHHSVWSNAAYVLSGLAALPALIPTLLATLSGAALTWFSGQYHRTLGDSSSVRDIQSMLLFLATTAGITLSCWTPAGYLTIPIAAGYYLWRPPNNNFKLMAAHVGGWALLIVIPLFVIVGWKALVPLAIFVQAVASRLDSETDSDIYHTKWHMYGGLGNATVLFYSIE